MSCASCPDTVRASASSDDAVGSLLDHWDTRAPLGPCHWGVGTRFMRVEYLFLRYNLFFYVYVLSFSRRGQGGPRFHSALSVLDAKLDDEGRLVVEQPHRDLKQLGFCAKGRPSAHATSRYREIRRNLA